MAKFSFHYQYKKLIQAQLVLTEVFWNGDVKSVALAFQHCTDAFKDFDVTQIKDEKAYHRIEAIKRLIDTTNVQDDTGEGIFIHCARAMNLKEKDEFSNALFHLVRWLDLQC
jgi:hypothetical protein